MKIKISVILIAVFVIGIGGIILTKALGIWSTESNKIPAKFNKVEGFEGQYRADDIRGSYTFGEISELYGIPLDHLAASFGVPNDRAESFKCKELETLYEDSEQEIGTGSVKLFAAFYLGQPYSLSENTYLLDDAKEIIQKHGNATQEQLTYLNAHTLSIGAPSTLSSQTPEKLISSASPDSSPESKVASNNEKIGSQTEKQGDVERAESGGNGLAKQINIKGSTYLKDISVEFSIPIGDLAAAFQLTTAEGERFQVKDIRNKFSAEEVEISVGSVALFIAFYNGMEYDLTESNAFLPLEGAEKIKTNGKATQTQLDYLETHTWTGK